jgi:hypothetical protein
VARWMRADTKKLYRVVVVERNGLQTIYGPYEYKRSAGYVRSYMTKSWWGADTKDSWIEVSDPIWTKDD